MPISIQVELFTRPLLLFIRSPRVISHILGTLPSVLSGVTNAPPHIGTNDFVLLCSHDRTMQDIVYKLVPGLQEGECQSTAGMQRKVALRLIHVVFPPVALQRR